MHNLWALAQRAALPRPPGGAPIRYIAAAAAVPPDSLGARFARVAQFCPNPRCAGERVRANGCARVERALGTFAEGSWRFCDVKVLLGSECGSRSWGSFAEFVGKRAWCLNSGDGSKQRGEFFKEVRDFAV